MSLVLTGANLVITANFDSNVTLNPSPNFIGLVSTASIQGKTETIRAKTIEYQPFAHNASGFATLAVPTGDWFITSLVANSNATVRFNILSGATYLTGNASLGINLAPLGGFVESGTIDAPIYKSLAANEGIVIETDSTAAVVGKIGYYVE